MTEFNTIAAPKVVSAVDMHHDNSNANRRRIEREEAELEALLKGQQAPEQEEEEQEETVEAKPVKTEKAEPKEKLSAEEETYKKRYGDLRNHLNVLNERIKELEAGKREDVRPPKSDEDIAAWAAKYPDVAAIVETIAERKAAEKFKLADERLQKIDEQERLAQRNSALAAIRKAHPDFDDLQASDDFHNWAAEQTKFTQDALYENETNAKDVITVINAYKYDRGLDSKSISKKEREAASAVMTKRTTKPTDGEIGKTFSESQIQRMSLDEYIKLEAEIDAARREGRFVYDLSGGAR